MSDERKPPQGERNPPQSVSQAAANVAGEVVGGLKESPWFLALVVINGAGIAAAVWFLHALLDLSKHRWEQVLMICKQFGVKP